jgi:hypothetical protein
MNHIINTHMQQTVPFLSEGIDDLSIDDIIEILCSTSPIVRITEITNCKNHYNTLLQQLHAKTMEILDDDNKIVEVDTNVFLSVLCASKRCDLLKMVEDIEEYLDPTFIIQVRRYLNGGYADNRDFRQKKCKPKKILKKGMNIAKLKKKINQRKNH